MTDRVGEPAVAIEDAAVSTPSPREVTALERERSLVKVLSRIAVAAARLDDLERIVQLVTDESTALSGAQFGAFFYNVVGPDGDAWLYTISGAPISAFERFPMPRATDVFRPTFEGRAPVRIDDVLADPRYGRNPPYNGMPPNHLPVRSYLAVPVFAPGGTVLGGLFFGHEAVGMFTEDDERVVTEIAVQAGVAIDRAQLVAAARNAQAEAEARAHATVALEFVEDGIVMVDRQGFVRLWNSAAAAATGLEAAVVLNRPIGEAVPSWERIVLEIPVGAPSENVTPATLPLDTLQGRELWLSLYGIAFGDGTVYAFRDVTHDRMLEALRADVITTVSHELRTPVSSVYGAAKTLLRGDLNPEAAAQLLAIIDSESERLTHLVDEILLTSQIDSDALSLARDAFDPLQALKRAIEASPNRAASVVVDAPEHVAPVAGDEGKVQQVLDNLIENALKYGTANGNATVTLRLTQASDHVRFEVTDSGPGIPESEQVRIFEKFYRLDPHLRGGIGGTGLGLYICHELVHRMQGRIGVNSDPGHGATFWFQIPLA